MDEETGSLLNRLLEHARSGAYPLHMPGHKRNGAWLDGSFPGELDLTEIEGFDDLHAPEGILKAAMDNAALVYGSRASRFLVNGASGGLLAAIAATTRRGDAVIVARNCHRSVYYALELLGLSPFYLMPATDASFGVSCSVSPKALSEMLDKHLDVRLCVITSPTYDGVVSDVEAIASLLHARGIPLIVDEAHGAHLPFGGGFPESAMRLGADIVVQSLHKTLPSLTQTAILHVMSERVDMGELSRRISMFETTSPSYILMASIDECVRRMGSEGEKRLLIHRARLNRFSKQMRMLTHLGVLCAGTDALVNHKGFFDFDASKILISTHNANLTGGALAALLREKGFELEMHMGDTALALTSVCDEDEDIERFACALLEIDRGLAPAPVREKPELLPLPERKLPICEALAQDFTLVPLEGAAGRMSVEYIWAYPPGIPLLVPGEMISEALIEYVERERSCGVRFTSSRGNLPSTLAVC